MIDKESERNDNIGYALGGVVVLCVRTDRNKSATSVPTMTFQSDKAATTISHMMMMMMMMLVGDY
jgi:hypothetical protein